MKRALAIILTTGLLATSMAFAGNAKTVNGTISSIDGNNVHIADQNGHDINIQIADNSALSKGEAVTIKKIPASHNVLFISKSPAIKVKQDMVTGW
jgi:hypothetical protein